MLNHRVFPLRIGLALAAALLLLGVPALSGAATDSECQTEWAESGADDSCWSDPGSSPSAAGAPWKNINTAKKILAHLIEPKKIGSPTRPVRERRCGVPFSSSPSWSRLLWYPQPVEQPPQRGGHVPPGHRPILGLGNGARRLGAQRADQVETRAERQRLQHPLGS